MFKIPIFFLFLGNRQPILAANWAIKKFGKQVN